MISLGTNSRLFLAMVKETSHFGRLRLAQPKHGTIICVSNWSISQWESIVLAFFSLSLLTLPFFDFSWFDCSLPLVIYWKCLIYPLSTYVPTCTCTVHLVPVCINYNKTHCGTGGPQWHCLTNHYIIDLLYVQQLLPHLLHIPPFIFTNPCPLFH